MKKNLRSIVACTLLICACALAYGKDDETKLKGMIVARTADDMTVRAADGTTTVVVLTEDTKVQVPKGLVGLRRTQMSWTSLIPGLPVTVTGSTNAQGQIVASKVDFTREDLATASMIQAGLTPTSKKVERNEQNIGASQQAIASNQQAIATNQGAIASNQSDIAANKQQIATNQQAVTQRFEDLADYDVKNEATVYFSVGSSTLADKDKATLSSLAGDATKLQGYMIEVMGFADSTGTAALNQTLSKDRAEEVIGYLMQECNISPRHILAPAAMGISNPAKSNESPEGRSENRRVEVKVLVNKGVTGS
jgi:outer membrane protein OmpA-like peptidoglycan-associated protein